jgi:hypothetical protein
MTPATDDDANGQDAPTDAHSFPAHSDFDALGRRSRFQINWNSRRTSSGSIPPFVEPFGQPGFAREPLSRRLPRPQSLHAGQHQHGERVGIGLQLLIIALALFQRAGTLDRSQPPVDQELGLELPEFCRPSHKSW